MALGEDLLQSQCSVVCWGWGHDSKASGDGNRLWNGVLCSLYFGDVERVRSSLAQGLDGSG